MANKTYTYEDLISAYLDARRFQNAHADLKAYHTELYRYLSRLFEADFDKPVPTADWRREALWRLFHSTIRRYEETSSPFAGILEAPKEITELYRLHGKRLSESCNQLKQHYFLLLCDLHKRIYGDTGSPITSEDLKRQGFDDSTEPDEYDYL